MAENRTPPLAVRVDRSATALVIVDMQNDFILPTGVHVAFAKQPHQIDSGEVRSGEQLAPSYARMPSVVQANQALIAAARKAGVPVIWARIQNTRKTNARFWSSEGLFSCMIGTPGANLVDGLAPEPGDTVILKTRHSAFFGTNLDGILRMLRMDGVVVTGVGTAGCVEATVRDAMMRDYWVVIAGDACGSGDIEIHESALVRMNRLFGMVADSPEIIACWQSATAREAPVEAAPAAVGR
jgi:nicotinamidase-related amidase